MIFVTYYMSEGWVCLLGSGDAGITNKAIVTDGAVFGKEGLALTRKGLWESGRGFWDRRWGHVLIQKR